MSEKEFYLYTYQELIQKLGEEEAKKKAQWYKKDFLVKYPKTLCIINGNLMKTYKEE
jgi:hypothetical protein